METADKSPVADAAGKTKLIFKLPGTTMCRVVSTRAITAGDGAKRDEFALKDEYATTTTCRVFELLKACGIPVAFWAQTCPNEFRAEWTEMIPLEIVARRVIGDKSSYRKRHPHIKPGARLETLVVEFFLKTTDKRFGTHVFSKDDPLITSYGLHGVSVQRPDMPTWELHDNPEVLVPPKDVYGNDADVGFPFKELERLVRRVFLVLEGAWLTQGLQLCDLKIECGYTAEGKLVVSDVIDADSWRLVDAAGKGLDKQLYRDGGDLREVADIYAEVARRACRFSELHESPRIVLWCASEMDDPKPFRDELERLGNPAKLLLGVGSVHKNPEGSLGHFRSLALVRPSDTVVIAYVGRSNGAGPVFACDTHVPVIAVSPTVPKSPEDIWSSVNLPSNCPLMFHKYPANAVQAALGILAARSPAAYLARRSIVENAHLSPANSPSYGKSH